jgi:predicted NUDIX family NTP pyrophosphohydrolase
MHRRRPGALEVFLVHPGGPFWTGKDLGAWSIPKGECPPDEDLQAAARRELREETGVELRGALHPLAPIRQPGGKTIHAWAVEADCDPTAIRSNTFSIEWPPRSGTVREFPEVDRAAWFPLDEARERVVKGQRGFLDQLERLLAPDAPATGRGATGNGDA